MQGGLPGRRGDPRERARGPRGAARRTSGQREPQPRVPPAGRKAGRCCRSERGRNRASPGEPCSGHAVWSRKTPSVGEHPAPLAEGGQRICRCWDPFSKGLKGGERGRGPRVSRRGPRWLPDGAAQGAAAQIRTKSFTSPPGWAVGKVLVTACSGRLRTPLFSAQMKLLAFAVLALLAVTRAEEGARLLASKSLLNRYAVEGRDLTLQYNIYNVGSR